MNKKTAILYLRVSSEEQTRNFSLDNQKQRTTDYCKSNDYEIVRIFSDPGKSATSIAGRPGLLELLEYCFKHKGNIDAVVCYRLDRVSRNTLDFLEIKRRLSECGVKILSASEPLESEDPSTEFLTTILAAIARMDNEVRKARAVQGLEKRLENGLNITQIPMGYTMKKDSSGRNIPVRKEPDFSNLQKAGYMYMTNRYSMKQIADFLNEKGVRTMYGHELTTNSVGKFIKCEFYMGVIYAKRRNKRYKGRYEAMFTPEEWKILQDVAVGKPLGVKRSQRYLNFPLRNFVCSGLSGEMLTGSYSKGKNARFGYYYGNEPYKSIRKHLLEDAFMAVLNALEPTPAVLESFGQVLHDRYSEKYYKTTEDVKNIEENIAIQNMYKVQVCEKRMAENIDEETFNNDYNTVENHITVNNLARNELTIDLCNIDIARNFSKFFLEHLSNFWKVSSYEDKRRLQFLLFPNGLLWDFPGFRTPKISPMFRLKADVFSNPNIFIGEGGGDRTHDTLLKRQVL